MSQRTVLPEKLTAAQIHNQFLIFYKTRGLIPIFHHRLTHTLSPITLAHLSSVLTYILH